MSIRPQWNYEDPHSPGWGAARLSGDACRQIIDQVVRLVPEIEEFKLKDFLNHCASSGWGYAFYRTRAEAEPRFKEKRKAAAQIASRAQKLSKDIRHAAGTRYYFDLLAVRAGRTASFLDEISEDLALLSLLGDVACSEIDENEKFYKGSEFRWPPDPEHEVAERIADAYYGLLGKMPTVTPSSDSGRTSHYLEILRIVLTDFTGRAMGDTTLLSKARPAVQRIKRRLEEQDTHGSE